METNVDKGRGRLVVSGRPLQRNYFAIFRAHSLLCKQGHSIHKKLYFSMANSSWLVSVQGCFLLLNNMSILSICFRFPTDLKFLDLTKATEGTLIA